jgi:hypothetical protein
MSGVEQFGPTDNPEPYCESNGRGTIMKPRPTFQAIINVLRDGSWHEIDELTEATRFPAEWVEELSAEGVLDTSEEGDNLRVRLTDSAVA